MSGLKDTVPGTIVWIGPFYNRSGYGIGIRAVVSHLHCMGNHVRIIPVDEISPGIDDCDLELIRSLEKTPLVPPITAIIAHVPVSSWLQVKFPEPNLRIMTTTLFDTADDQGRLPHELLHVCRQMDQVWLHNNPKERELFLKAGFPPEKVLYLPWPHHWVENPWIPAAFPEPDPAGKVFRFVAVSMFLPRRRWDTLIEAFFQEFKDSPNVELYLKVNYPQWHPVPGKPQNDLLNLVATLKQKTRSTASLIIDDDLGTRLEVLNLIDRSNVYISTDTALTAPVFESIARQRLVIVPKGFVSWPPDTVIEIPVDPNEKKPITKDILEYQPYQFGQWMPMLHVKDVQQAMRQAYDMPVEVRRARAASTAKLLGSPTVLVKNMIQAIREGWATKQALELRPPKHRENLTVVWEGSQLVRHSLALVNREICMRLIDEGYNLYLIPFEPDEMDARSDPRFFKLIQRTSRTLPPDVAIHIRHHWPPNLIPPPKGRWVMFQHWEFGSLPKSWIYPLNHLVDEAWVSSSYVRNCYIQSGVQPDRVYVIPLGVDTHRFHPRVPPRTLGTRKKFRFLFVGGTIFRKGIDVLLKAYAAAFSNKDDVCLVIKDMGGKTFYRDQTSETMIQAIRSHRNAPEIEYMTEMLEERDMAALYKACHCLVHPYRGEGFGLPVAEAMACGLPVIITGHGSALDFCSEENAYLVPYRIKYFPEKRAGALETVDYPWLAEPDLEGLKHWMRHVYENPDEAQRKGQAGRAIIERQFTWEHTLQAVKDRLHALGKAPIRRLQNRQPLQVMPQSWKAQHGENRQGLKNDHPTKHSRNIPAQRETGVLTKTNAEQKSRPYGKTSPQTLSQYAFESESEGISAAHMSDQKSELPGKPPLSVIVEQPPQQSDHFSAPEPFSPNTNHSVCDRWKNTTEAAQNLESQRLVQIFLEEGEKRFKEGKLEDAKICFEMVLERQPDCALAHNNMGVLHWQAGDLSKALECFYRAFDLNPDHPDILLNSAKALEQAGYISEAGDILRHYLRKNPLDEDAWTAYEQLLLSISRPMWSPEGLPPSLAETYLRMGKELAAVHDFIGAREAYEKALKLDPSRTDIQNELARLRDQP